MVSTLAGSMMTVMGISFSITLLALVLASSHLRALNEQLQWIDGLVNRCIGATGDHAYRKAVAGGVCQGIENIALWIRGRQWKTKNDHRIAAW